MSVTYTIGFTVKPDQRERFLRLLGGVLDAMRDEETFINATLFADPESPGRFLLQETWRDHQDVVEVQVKRPYRAEWHAALPELLEGAREIGVWRTLRSDGVLEVQASPP